jgi:hypothetical protein
MRPHLPWNFGVLRGPVSLGTAVLLFRGVVGAKWEQLMRVASDLSRRASGSLLIGSAVPSKRSVLVRYASRADR